MAFWQEQFIYVTSASVRTVGLNSDLRKWRFKKSADSCVFYGMWLTHCIRNCYLMISTLMVNSSQTLCCFWPEKYSSLSNKTLRQTLCAELSAVRSRSCRDSSCYYIFQLSIWSIVRFLSSTKFKLLTKWEKEVQTF